jgi:hypothetical protein
MEKFIINLLDKLLTKYENSVLSKNGSNRNLKIEINSKDALLKQYFEPGAYNIQLFINEILKDLDKKEVIYAIFDKDDLIDRIELNIEKINNAYKLINRENPALIKQAYVDYLSNYTSDETLIGDFARDMISKINNFQSVDSYIDDLENLKKCILAIQELLKLETETLKRNFSVKVFNDSKTFEKIESRICKIIKDYGDVEGESNDEILESFNLTSNPTFVLIKGNVILKVNDQIIDLAKFKSVLSLDEKALLNTSVLDIETDKVMTIENLTSFYDFNDGEYISIYLGGFHNKVKRNFITKLFEFNPKLSFYHFGDIDAGGFYILNHLCNKTNINFSAFKMDVNTLISNKRYWKKLTINDNRRLKLLLNEPLISKYYETIYYMLDNNCKLEQESLSLIGVTEHEKI